MEEILKQVKEGIDNNTDENPLQYAEFAGKAKVVAEFGTEEEKNAAQHYIVKILLMLALSNWN